MKNKAVPLLLSGTLLLQSCVVMNYKLRNELDHPESEKAPAREIRYKVVVNGQSAWNYRSTPELDPEGRRAYELSYSKITRKVFDKKGLAAKEVNELKDVNFRIEVCITPFAGALPQEYLLGFTFFIIPVWGTRPTEFTYTFEHVGVKKPHSYYVDLKSYAHWLCLPVFWVNFITMNETKGYKNALSNYLENALPEGIIIEDPPPSSTQPISVSKYNTFIYYGNKAIDEGCWNKAERAFRLAMTQVEGGNLSPKYRAKVLYGFGKTRLNMGDFDEAATLLEQAMEADEGLPDGVTLLNDRASLSNAYYEQGRFDDAAKLFEQVLQIAKKLPDADNASSIYALADLSAEYYEHGRFQDGAKLLHQISRLYPRHADQLRLQNKKELKQIFSDYAAELRKLGEEQEAGELELFAVKICLKRRTNPRQENKAE